VRKAMEDQPQPDLAPKDKKQYQVQLLKRRISFSLMQAVAFVAVFAVIGSAILIKSFAASPQAEIRGPILDTTEASHSVDTLLVGFKPGVSAAVQQALLARYQAKVNQDIPQTGAKIISVPAEAQEAVKDALSHNPAVSFAEYDQRAKMFDTTPNDYWWPNEWSEVRTQANKAWDISQGSASTIVAVLDTGVDSTQPDLQGAFVPGWNTLANSSDTTDADGHGTMSAGVGLARSNNTTGVASYCWRCSLMPVKVLDANAGSISSVSSGITWAADHGAKVITMSLGFTASSSTLQSAVTYAHNKGVVILAAAGNYGTSSPVYPAAYPEVLGVAGTDGNDALYSWSGFGSWVKIAAPGCNFTTGTSAWYGTFCGTSSASPAAAGIAGLVRSYAAAASNTQIEQALESSAVKVSNVQYGRLDAYAAIQALGATTTPPADTTAPTASISSPAGAATVSGSLSVNVSASDNVGVSKVELYVDGSLYASTTTSPYDFFLNTSAMTNGSHTLLAKAYDAAGNIGASSTVTITVSNLADTVAPAVTISSPANGSTVTKKALISAAGTDNVSVTSMEIYIDGVLKASSTSGSITYTWSINRNVKAGSHTITVKAYDAAGNVGQSSVSVSK
jgi:thermitase